MRSGLDDLFLAATPWVGFLACVLWLYSGARLYGKTRTMSPRSWAYLAGAVGFALLAITHFEGLLSPRVKIVFDIVSLVCMLAMAVLFSFNENEFEPKRRG
jgi:hypothetical protein